MKRSFLFLLIFICSTIVFSQERKFNFYSNLSVDLGGTIPYPISDIPEGAEGTPRIGPSLGFGSEYDLNNSWQFALESNYHIIAYTATTNVVSQSFTNGAAQLYFTGHTETDIELRMISFPLLAFYKFKKGHRILLGAYYSTMLEAKFETEGTDGISSDDKSITDNAIMPGTIDESYSFSENIDSYDFGVLIGYSYSLGQRMYIWTKINAGFKSIFKKEFDSIDYDLYQVRINLGVSFKLFN